MLHMDSGAGGPPRPQKSTSFSGMPSSTPSTDPASGSGDKPPGMGRKARASSTRDTSFSGGSAAAGGAPSGAPRPPLGGKQNPGTGPPPRPFASSGGAAGPGAGGFGGQKAAWGSTPTLPGAAAPPSVAMRLEHGRRRMADWDPFVAMVQRGGLQVTFDMIPWIGVATTSASDEIVQLCDVGVSASVCVCVPWLGVG